MENSMYLKTINYIKETTFRFPLPVIFSFLSIIIFNMFMHAEQDNDFPAPIMHLFLSSMFAIPLFTQIYIFRENKDLNRRQNNILTATGFIILSCIFILLNFQTYEHFENIFFIRYLIFFVLSHILISLIPYMLSRTNHIQFMLFNQMLFVRSLVSAFYGAVIFGGLSIAVLIFQYLLDTDVSEKFYLNLLFFTVFGFNTFFVLGGIPKNINTLEEEENLSNKLRIFLMYVALPLTALYLLILLFYGLKIMVTWDWPKGIVTVLILCISFAGILTFLLIQPYANQKPYSWVSKASKIFYTCLIPLLIIYFLAIQMRLEDYGITSDRYLVIALGVWLTIVSAYNFITNHKTAFIPLSLAIMLAVISFGPWSMFSVSEKSQVKRLEKILTQNKILVDGKISNEVIWNRDSLPDLVAQNTLTNDNNISDSLKNEVRSILDYLNESHGFENIQSWYQQDMLALGSQLKKENESDNTVQARFYMQTMGLQYYTTFNTQKEIIFNYEFYATEAQVSVITGFDYSIKLNSYPDRENTDSMQTFYVNDIRYDLKFNGIGDMKLFIENEKDKIEFNLAEWHKENKDKYHPPYSEDLEDSTETEKTGLIILQGAGTKYKSRMELNSLIIEKEGDNYTIGRIEGTLFLKKK